MNDVFIRIVDMSINAGWLVLFIILLRLIFKKIPRNFLCIMWGMAALRLICPFSLSSLFPAQIASNMQKAADAPIFDTGIQPSAGTAKEYIEISVNQVADIADILRIIWIIGISLMLLVTFISVLRLNKKKAQSILLLDNIFICDEINTPFISGISYPKIYIPSFIDKDQLQYVVAHEKAHIKRLDHIWKLLGYILLIIYWFDPLVWIAYILFCRDMELACDEKVIRQMDSVNRASYSQALLNCSIDQRKITVYQPAFGETGVKKRVSSVLNYRKPTVKIIAFSVVICVAVAVCLIFGAPDVDVYNGMNFDSVIYGSYAEGCVETYYRSLYSAKDELPDFGIGMSEACGKYLENKYDHDVSAIKNADISEVKTINTSILEYEVIDGYFVCDVAVNITFKYSDNSGLSSLTETVQVALNCKNTPEIADFYNGEPNTYESRLRGYGLDLSDISNLVDE